MANSKSNIYPIALQNAELNLNKYDAEIKQYSGFNKNNAPFVGGCLSNIFTKDEIIEGANGENVYIDDNGDIYQVTTEGLFKNNEKIIEYPDNVKFYKKTKTNKNPAAIYYISETVYISIEWKEVYENEIEAGSNTHFYCWAYVAHWGDGYSQVLCDSKQIASITERYLDIAYSNGCIVFSVKRRRGVGGYQKELSYVCLVPNENEEACVFVKPNYATKFYVYDVTSSRVQPQTTFIDENYIYYAENVSKTGTYGSQIYVFSRTEGSIEYLESFHTFTSSYFSGYTFLSYDFGQYKMLKSGELYFSGSLQDFTISAAYNFIVGVKLKYENNSLVVPGYNSLLIKQLDNNFNNKVVNIVSRVFSDSCYYFNCILDITDTTDNTKGAYISHINNRVNLAYSLPDFKINTGLFFTWGNFKVLINNNEVSNISVYREIEDSHIDSFEGATVEDWNNIKSFNFYDNKCIYELYNGDIYIIEETDKPSLSLKYNQLVVNCNYHKNSFKLTTREILHFASDWNCSYIGSGVGYEGYYGTKRTENGYFVASAINEYKRENNSSIIINMQAVAYPFYNSYEAPRVMLGYNIAGSPNMFVANYVSLINFYTGSLTDNQAVYLVSSDNTQKEDLKGLPFPGNSDGNVTLAPNMFSDFISSFGNEVYVKNENNVYQLSKDGQNVVMDYYLGTLIEGLSIVFILQGQYYGIFNDLIFSIQFFNGVISSTTAVVSIENLQFCGNTPYEALFYSKTNRCLYSFTGANILQQKQLVDKISVVRSYKYNPATQSIFLLTDIGVIVSSLFGIYCIDMLDAMNMFLLSEGVVFCNNSGTYKYIKYYKKDTDADYLKENIKLETMFYGMDNQTVTINDCLYIRLYSEDHEEGEIVISASTLSLQGRKTEKTTFKFKAADWDKMTHTIYLRYQPKEQRGLGISFSIDSPFKIASLSVGSKPDAILVDKVSKGAVNEPFTNRSSNIEW